MARTIGNAYAWSQAFWPFNCYLQARVRTMAQNNHVIENPAFFMYRQNQVISNTILALVDPNLAPMIVTTSTSQAS